MNKLREVDPPRVPKSHIVQKGETLVTIAKKYTDDTYNWIDLYNDNTEIIGSNPSKLKIGTILNIPANW